MIRLVCIRADPGAFAVCISLQTRVLTFRTGHCSYRLQSARGSLPLRVSVLRLDQPETQLMRRSMGTFFVAMAWTCFDRSSVWTRLLTGIIFALVVTLVVLVVMLELWPPITDEDVDERGCLGSIRHNLVSRVCRMKVPRLKGTCGLVRRCRRRKPRDPESPA